MKTGRTSVSERVARYEALCARMARAGYTAHEAVLTDAQANALGLLCAAPFVAPLWTYYRVRFYGSTVVQAPAGESNLWALLFVALLLLSLPLHELLHGAFWRLAGRRGRGSIHFSFSGGMLLCSCGEPLSGGAYLLGVLGPFLTLGLGSLAVSLVWPGLLQMLLASALLACCGADLLIALRALPYRRAVIADHPVRAGFIAFTRAEG